MSPPAPPRPRCFWTLNDAVVQLALARRSRLAGRQARHRRRSQGSAGGGQACLQRRPASSAAASAGPASGRIGETPAGPRAGAHASAFLPSMGLRAAEADPMLSIHPKACTTPRRARRDRRPPFCRAHRHPGPALRRQRRDHPQGAPARARGLIVSIMPPGPVSCRGRPVRRSAPWSVCALRPSLRRAVDRRAIHPSAQRRPPLTAEGFAARRPHLRGPP